jgi:hypothetical protein
LRNTQEPNHRIQDVPKERLLCRSCEERFSRSEDVFSRDIFTPAMDGEELTDVVITRQHRDFCASLAWRALVMTLRWRGGDDVADYDDDDWAAMQHREEQLRAFLLDNGPHPADLEHHLFCSRSTAETEQEGFNALLNLSAGIAVRGDGDAPERLYGLVFLNGLILITLLRSAAETHQEWCAGSTRVEPGALWRNHHQHIRDGYFGRLLNGLAQQIVDEREKMSPAQRKTVSDALAGADMKRWADSPHGKAVLQDYVNREARKPEAT